MPAKLGIREDRFRGFHFETEMVRPVMRWMRQQRLMVKSEFLLPWGVCDLVGVRLDPQKAQRRLSFGQTGPIGSFLRLLILSRIPDCETRKSISVRKLTKDLSAGIPPDVLLRELKGLTRDKFVRVPRSGFLQKVNGWAPLHTRVVAVELKLSRLSKALSQAGSNRAFATDSYVAFPAARALRIVRSESADVLVRSGIGLLAVSHDVCRELIKPTMTSSTCDQLIQTHVVERFWRTRDS